jgi:thiamine-monophosphate kinase
VVYREAVPCVGSLESAINGGEDYELLFTARTKTKIPAMICGVPITPIGEIAGRSGMWLADPSGRRKVLRPRGWEHFRKDEK